MRALWAPGEGRAGSTTRDTLGCSEVVGGPRGARFLPRWGGATPRLRGPALLRGVWGPCPSGWGRGEGCAPPAASGLLSPLAKAGRAGLEAMECAVRRQPPAQALLRSRTRAFQPQNVFQDGSERDRTFPAAGGCSHRTAQGSVPEARPLLTATPAAQAPGPVSAAAALGGATTDPSGGTSGPGGRGGGSRGGLETGWGDQHPRDGLRWQVHKGSAATPLLNAFPAPKQFLLLNHSFEKAGADGRPRVPRAASGARCEVPAPLPAPPSRRRPLSPPAAARGGRGPCCTSRWLQTTQSGWGHECGQCGGLTLLCTYFT